MKQAMSEQEMLEEAQARLMAKRQEEGLTETGAHTQLTTSSQNEFGRMFASLKCNHGISRADKCEQCEEQWRIEAESREKREKEKREAEVRKEAEREAARIRERIERPEKWLAGYGVPKKFINCSFDSFHGGEKIKAILRKFPEQNILLHGTTGSGKTHLAVATLRDLVQRDAIQKAENIYGWSSSKTIKDAIFVTTPDLLLSIRSSFSTNSDEKELVERYTKPSILILDDLGADKATEWAITTLYLIIDNRNKELMPTIVTTNLTMQEIENQYGARIASRLSDMRIINIAMPDWRKKRNA